MKNETAYADMIKKRIEEFEEEKHTKLSAAASLRKQAQELDAEIEILGKLISSIKGDLQEHSPSTLETDDKKTLTEYSATKHKQKKREENSNLYGTQPTISINYTFYLIDKSKQALQANDLVNEYKKMGLSTYNRQMNEHLSNLEESGRIYCINPDAKRSKRYKASKNNVTRL